MITFILCIASAVIGFIAGALVYRNNTSNLRSAEDKAREAAKILGGK